MAEPQEPNPEPHERRTGSAHAHHSAPAGGPQLDIIDADRRLDPAAAAWLRAAAGEALRAALNGSPGGAAAHVRLLIVGDERMSDLHRRHMGVDGPTDVLTFDLRESAGEPLDTDIAVCFDEAARQSAPRSAPPERELLLYFVHGVLHCLGHDDHDDADAARMHRREDEILSAIGVGPVFAAPVAGGARERAR